MKKVGFIGAYDKTDMLLNIAKVLTMLNNRVLLVDSSINQKAKYIVPTINPTVSYITSFEDIDVAIGFKNVEDIKKYTGTKELQYDILLIDCDIPERIETFELSTANKNYFVTSFDMYSLRRGIEIISEITTPLELTKILFAKEILKEDDDYLNYISLGYKINWNEERIYFPIENGDLTVIAENQRVEKIKFRRLSTEYKDSVGFIATQILELKNDSQVRRVIKSLEKGV